MTAASSPEPTITAIATPPGPGGIGVIRISGPKALAIAQTIFQPAKPGPLQSHQLTYGHVIDGHQQVVDEVLAVYMRAPRTYTREDVVEIHCHGSFLILRQVLALITAAGAVLAGPGEFTKRAFLNGRIDLTQAEAVMALLEAKTATGLDMARQHLSGRLCAEVEAMGASLIRCRSIIEVAIDFPDEDVEIIQAREMAEQLTEEVIRPLSRLIKNGERGRVYREGVSLVILGRPNVGKSSLLNALLGEDRAIVTAVPGTTRDTLEESLEIRSIPVKITDTAGIREEAGAVEEMGIRRAREKLATADLVLFMVDAEAGVSEEDRQLRQLTHKPTLYVVNKIDIVDEFQLEEFQSHFPDLDLVPISARKGEGLAGLQDAIARKITGGEDHWDPGHATVPNLRHQQGLGLALEATEQVVAGLAANLPPDLLAIELQTAMDGLAEIIGETSTDDILDIVFQDFCLGK
ncbi:MAG: tRNA uridine-5-carboxymethylaminomethyl(34) synthesis GTPase MnmE [Thermodesulfobacteriota bacterium]